MVAACGRLVAGLGVAVLLGACSTATRLRGPLSERQLMAREVLDSLTRTLQAARSDRAFPGAYAIVGDTIGVIAEFGVGRLDWTWRAARPTRETLWDLASLTKVIGTTTAVAQLVERGAVRLDAPVQAYLPDWTGPGQDAVTIRHLLTHTSGLPSFRRYDTLTHAPDSLARLLFRTPLEGTPGDRMVYSDIGAFVMGEVVTRVSGETFDGYLALHVFGPLRMRSTMFRPADSLRRRIAPTEVDTLRGGLVRGFVHDERAHYLGGVASHAGLFSTAADVARFAEMMLRGGRIDSARVLHDSTIALFTPYQDSARHNRALGWQKAPAPWAGQHASSSAYGHTGFTGTSIAVDPALGVYIVLLSNRVNPTRANNRIGAVRARVADAIIPVIRRHRELTSHVENP